jgi:hypothetical protein
MGRRRVRARLHAEAARLVDMHVGRARSDFQSRLTEVSRVLCTSVRVAYSDRARRLAAALDGRREDEARAAGHSDVVVQDALRQRQTALSELTSRLQDLLGGERSRLARDEMGRGDPILQ